MSILKLAVSLFIFFIFSTSIFAQKKENLSDWLKIKVFVSTREEVEKLFGIPRKSQYGFNNRKEKPIYTRLYNLSNATAFITYSKGGCSSDLPLWDLPEWTVTEIDYSPDEGLLKLENLIPNKKLYKTRQAGDVRSHIEYYDDEKGIAIIYDKEINEILSITLYPSLSDKKSRDCNSLDKNKKLSVLHKAEG